MLDEGKLDVALLQMPDIDGIVEMDAKMAPVERGKRKAGISDAFLKGDWLRDGWKDGRMRRWRNGWT